MRSIRLLFVVACVALTGCPSNDGGNNNKKDGGGLPDGFINEGCVNATDCDDGDPCTEDRCTNKKCTYRAKDCSEANDACNTGVCDPSDGSCVKEPANDNAACTTASDDPGTCSGGFCDPAPTCSTDGYLSCSYSTTDTNSTSGSSVISDYQCVQGLTGPEYAYSFYTSTDKRIKLTLTSTADLDLIVLKGYDCVATAECVASATTAGSGNETLEFDAKAGEDYVVVVDGRNGAKGDYTITVDCEGCKPKQALACNQTVMGDTTSATATTTVGGLYCMLGAGGPEEVYTVDVAPGTRFRITMSGAATEHDLIAFPDENGKCADPYCSEYSTNDNPMNDTVTVTNDASSSTTSKYSVVVDARATGGAYQLQVDCPILCNAGAGSLGCDSGKLTAKNDDAKSTKLIDSYSCKDAVGLTGNEMIYEFSPYYDGDYTIDLSGLTANLALMVIEADGYYSSAVCDPTALCVASNLADGASKSVTFTADSYKMYYIIIDGKDGAPSNYNLKVNSTLCPAPSCYESSNELSCTYRVDARANNDPKRSKNLIDTWACGTNMTGNEVIYQVPIDKDGSYKIELVNAPTGLNLFVLKGLSYDCDPTTTCEVVTNKAATINAKAGDYYYAIVDGKDGLSADYKIQISSTACGAAKCVNPYESLDCNTTKTYAGRNDASGATRNVNKWDCSTSDKYTAAEFVHYFSPPKAGMYTVQLAGLTADLDLMVIEADSTTCKADAPCAKTTQNGTTNAISSNDNPAMATESVTFYAKAGKKYFFVVDGYSETGAEVASDYIIFISSCEP